MPKTNNSQPNPQPQNQKVRRRLSPKAAALLFIIIVVIAVIGIIVVKVQQWKNDGARYAVTLSEHIGVSPETAQKYARITLSSTSAFPCINMVLEPEQLVYESKDSVEVSGVTIPEWVVAADTLNNVVTEVTFYDYRQLKRYGNGVETSGHIDATTVNNTMTPEAVQKHIGFAPFCTRYTSSGVVETYKYYYEDSESGNIVSYLLHISYQNGVAFEAKEQENHFILSVLTLP